MKLMTIHIEHRGQVGRISEAFANLIQDLKPGPYEVTVKARTVKRSVDQNEYYWAVIIDMISKHTGYDPEVVHAMMAKQFLSRREYIRNYRGKSLEFTYVISTTKLSTQEFEVYLERIRRFAAEQFALSIPLPNEA